MPRMSKATVFVGLPKENPGPNRYAINFGHDTDQSQLARDIVEALRAKGYDVKGVIEHESKEEL
jgi:hypothetical protein